MADIKHSISIGAEPNVVYALVSSGQGFAKWWASEVTEEKPGGNVELGFFKRATVYGLKPIELVAPGRHTGSAIQERSGAAHASSSTLRLTVRILFSVLPTPSGRQRRIISSRAPRPGEN